MDQDMIKKVIDGVKCHADVVRAGLWGSGCLCCPYVELKHDNCRWKLIEDVIQCLEAMLKAQEPRVMTLEEVKASKGNDIYLELSSCPDDTTYITAATIDGVGKCGVSFYHTGCNFCNYGRRAYGWRCWTSRPDEKRRTETPWN